MRGKILGVDKCTAASHLHTYRTPLLLLLLLLEAPNPIALRPIVTTTLVQFGRLWVVHYQPPIDITHFRQGVRVHAATAAQ